MKPGTLEDLSQLVTRAKDMQHELEQWRRRLELLDNPGSGFFVAQYDKGRSGHLNVLPDCPELREFIKSYATAQVERLEREFAAL